MECDAWGDTSILIPRLVVTNDRSWEVKSVKKHKLTKWIPRGSNNQLGSILRTFGTHISNIYHFIWKCVLLLRKNIVDKIFFFGKLPDKIFVGCLVCYRFQSFFFFHLRFYWLKGQAQNITKLNSYTLGPHPYSPRAYTRRGSTTSHRGLTSASRHRQWDDTQGHRSTH